MTKRMDKELRAIRRRIEKERVSYGDLNFLQSHVREVLETGDIVLAQWGEIEENDYFSAMKNIVQAWN